MLCHVGEYGIQGSNTQGVVVGDGNMVLAVLLGGKSNMTSGLPAGLVTVFLKGFYKLLSINIAREFHKANVSSRVTCI